MLTEAIQISFQMLSKQDGKLPHSNFWKHIVVIRYTSASAIWLDVALVKNEEFVGVKIFWQNAKCQVSPPLSRWACCSNGHDSRCQPSHFRTTPKELEKTTGASALNLDLHISDNLELTDARDSAQNWPFWRMLAKNGGTMHL